jgi:biotin synthase
MKKQDWCEEILNNHFEMRFFELIHKAYCCHKENHTDADIELCVLSSIKTGTCPEDCAYCPQSGHYKTGLKREKLISVNAVLLQAKSAKANGAKRLCMGAAWRSPPDKDFPQILEMIKAVKNEGLETCMTLGMLNISQAKALKLAGLDYYNHNLDTSPEYYSSIITTRTYSDRLQTLAFVADAGINVCCGGILGMGESRQDRIRLLMALKSLKKAPTSIPINQLIPIPGTPLANQEPIDSFEFIRFIAITRLMFPKSMIRLSAGRESMSDEMQAWCFMAGANSIFYGDKLLTASNSTTNSDKSLLKRLNLTACNTEMAL